jgi:hypothetical protein
VLSRCVRLTNVSNRLVLFGLLSLLCIQVSAGTAEPIFSDYRVKVEKILSPKINLRSHRIGRKYQSQIRFTVKNEGVNFAGHYTVVEWGCGTNCSHLAIVNLRTGKIWYDPELIASRGFLFRSDSSLIVVNPWDGPGDFLPNLPTEYFVFRGGKLQSVGVVKHAA